MSWIVVSQMFGFIFGWTGAATVNDVNITWFIALTCPALPLYALIKAVVGCFVGRAKASEYESEFGNFGLGSFTTLAMAAPMIGAFVAVGQMLAAHGSCSAVVN